MTLKKTPFIYFTVHSVEVFFHVSEKENETKSLITRHKKRYFEIEVKSQNISHAVRWQSVQQDLYLFIMILNLSPIRDLGELL